MKTILIDMLFCLAFLIVCGIAGAVINEFRTNPLPIIYSPPSERLHQEVDHLNLPSLRRTIRAKDSVDVNQSEMLQIIATHNAVIFDARPTIFYRFGHVPSALSLPRDDFENHYKALKSTLEPLKEQSIIVYCSDEGCQDSQMVAEALRKLGYEHVRRYPGGWAEWQAMNGPEEK